MLMYLLWGNDIGFESHPCCVSTPSPSTSNAAPAHAANTTTTTSMCILSEQVKSPEQVEREAFDTALASSYSQSLSSF